tara:strand:- start:12164 stop:12991 length:828 start_codon:yes stop_codon:yes gene_type:complete
MYKCGITGGSGTLGKYLLKQLPFRFSLYDNRIENKKKIFDWLSKNRFDLIIHLAAIVPTKNVESNYKKALRVNYIGTKNIVDTINKNTNKPKWFFYASTSHVYNSVSNKKILESTRIRPYSKYGFTKAKAEKYIKTNLKIPYAIGRIFSYTHYNQSTSFLIPSLVKKIKAKKRKFVNLNHYRDFVHIDDISSAINLMWKVKARGVFNIGSGKKINVKDIATFLNKKINKRHKIFFNDNKESTSLIASNKKLKKRGWKPKKKIITILNDYLKKKDA